MSEFNGRHILVTGASTGIGLATAQLLARRGAKVFLLARNEEKLAAATDTITREGGAAAYGAADVSDRDALLAVIGKAEAYRRTARRAVRQCRHRWPVRPSRRL